MILSSAMPNKLKLASRLQSQCCARLYERMAQEWRRAFSEQLVDSIQDAYDVFQSDYPLFRSSALFRLLKHMELRLSCQLRISLMVSKVGRV